MNVLGPVAVDGDRESLTPRDRVVLAALAMTPGEVVSSDRLADALWGEEPPTTWSKVVQGCVVRLRKVLGSDTIRTTRQGYALDVPHDAVDAFQFERLLRRARELLSLQEPERARYTVSQALGLWYGAALADLDGWPPAEDAASRWEEMRRDAEELGVEASLEAGAWRVVLTEAGRLVADGPYRETRWALLARAQYQAGRQAESLATLQRARAVLTGELGLDPGPDLAALETAILQQDPSLVPGPERVTASTVCPYRGLLFYDVDDSEQYFGRDAEVDICRQVLDRQGFVAVAGPSGSGKSSLVRAGVAASLRRDGRTLTVITPGAHPMAALADVTGLRADVVLVVDQLEEAVTVCADAAEREAFFDALAERAAAGQETVLALRADSLGLIARHKRFSRLLERGLHLLGAMNEDDLRIAVEGPAHQAGLLLEAGLVDILVHEVAGEPGALPLLSHALAQTWKRREGGTLTVEGYRASGGIQGAVAQTAEHVFMGLTPEAQGTVRDLMLRLVVSFGAGEPSRSPVPRRAAAPDRAHEQVVETLVAARLLTSDGEILSLAHESLARAWPRLRTWLDADSEGQLILRHLTLAADAWQLMGQPESELYRGARLARAQEWRAATVVELTDTEAKFLDASVARAHQESRSAEERVREQAGTNRRLRGLLAGVVAVLVLALVAGGLAIREGRRADDQTRLAVVRELAASSRAVQEDDPELSVLLALEATSPGLNQGGAVPREAVEALHTAVVSSRVVLNVEGVGGTVAWSPTGKIFATEGAEESGLVDIRDAATGESLASFPGHKIDVNEVEFGRGGLLATAGDDGAVRVWSAKDRSLELELTGEGEAWSPSFSDTEPLMIAAAWPQEGVVRVASLAGDAEEGATTEIPLPGGPAPVDISPDGETLAISNYNPTKARVIDSSTGSTRYRLGGSGFHVRNVEYSPDGRWLATSSVDGRVRVRDAGTGRIQHSVSTATGELPALAWTTDSRHLAAGGFDGAIRVYEVTPDTARMTMTLAGSSTVGGVVGVAFSPDGSRLLSGDFQGTVATVWDVGPKGDAEVMNVVAPAAGSGTVAYDPDGRLYAPGETGSISVWDGDDGAPVAELDEGTDSTSHTPQPETSVALSADGSTAATGQTCCYSSSPRAMVWDVASGDLLFSVEDEFTWRPAISSDGGLVALAGDQYLTIYTRHGKVLRKRSAKDGFGFKDPAFSPDGRSVAVIHFPQARPRFTDSEVVLWKWEENTTSSLYTGTGWRLSYSPDGTRLAMANTGAPPRIIEVPSGDLAFELEGNAAGVMDVAFSPDGSKIATGGIDGTAIVWDATDGSPLLQLPTQPHQINGIAFSPNGRHIATGSWVEDVVRVWTLDLAELRQIATTKVVRGLTTVECATYLHNTACPVP